MYVCICVGMCMWTQVAVEARALDPLEMESQVSLCHGRWQLNAGPLILPSCSPKTFTDCYFYTFLKGLYHLLCHRCHVFKLMAPVLGIRLVFFFVWEFVAQKIKHETSVPWSFVLLSADEWPVRVLNEFYLLYKSIGVLSRSYVCGF